MNKRQLAAIERIGKAMSAAKHVGLAFAGVGDTLCVFRLAEFEAKSEGRSPAEFINDMDYVSFRIIDSGAA